MASWTDGAAYAPIERPDGFASPRVDPLPVGEPYEAGTPGNVAAPAQFDAEAQRPIEEIGAEVAAKRDPRDAFQVSAAALTSTPGAPTGRRDPRDPFPSQRLVRDEPVGPPLPAAGPPPTQALPQRPSLASTQQPGPPAQPWGQPAPQRAAAPSDPSSQPTPPRYPQQPGQYPPPYQGQQNQPAPYAGPQGVAPGPSPMEIAQQRRLAQIAGALCLGGFLIQPAAALCLVIAGALGMRSTRLTKVAGPISLGLGVFALVGQLLSGSLGQTNVLTSLISLAFAFVFFILAVKRD